MKNHYLSSFTPSLMSSETLEAIFVQREKLAEDLLAGIKESATTKNKHYRLLVGMRGIGKTHTIALIYHRLQKEAELQGKLLIAWLKEEEWGISSWLDLQLRIFQALKNSYPQEYKIKLEAEVESMYVLSSDEATIKGENLIKEYVGEKTLLLLTENLDEIFKGLGDKGQKKLRAYLQNHNFITIVATSQSLFNGVTSKKSPFYGFFNPQRLDKLSLEEATNLLSKIAEFKEDNDLAEFIKSQTGCDRIKAIHHLAGGNHRVYIIFSQFLTRDSLDDLVQPVMQTLDELMPYYQARMQWLSPQQRKIIELLCDRRNAVPVKEIAQRCFISQQTASSQLKDLLIKGYVVKETLGRASFYELQEPLMRICLETKKQRGEPIKLFIDFLRIWYTHDELKLRLQQLPENCLEKKYILEALKLKAFLAKSNVSKNDKKIESLIKLCKNKYRQNEYLDALSICDRISQDSTDNTYEIQLLRIASLTELGRYQEAIASIDELLTKKPMDGDLWFIHGLILQELERNIEAINSYEQSIKINSNNYFSWLSYGYALNALDKNKEAIQFFNRAIEINPNDDRAWVILAGTQTLLNKNEEAVQSFDRAIEINPNLDFNWVMYGISLFNSGRYREAIQMFEKEVATRPDNNSTWFYLGIALLAENNWNGGISALENGFILTKDINEFYGGDTKAILQSIFEDNQDINIWNQRLKILLKLYAKYKVVSALRKGIVENILNLLSETVSDKTARTWLEVWQKVGGDKPELEIALKFLKTAVEYKETKGDRKVLLQLPKEERDLFETLLEVVSE